MRAIVTNKYGSPDVLEIMEVDKPIPLKNQVLVKIHATSLNFGNLVLLKGEPLLARVAFGLLKPKYSIPGGDIAGQVEAVGQDVKQFQPGDEVFGDLSGCGWGGLAEYVSVPETALASKPSNLTFEEAAAVPMAGVTALQGLRDKGRIKPGQKVLINGASGGVGTFAVQIAKSFGAEVTGVCSQRNAEITRAIGADYVVVYTEEDFTQNTKRYDLIFGVNGSHSISAYKRVLSHNGTFIHVGGSGSQLLQSLIQGPFLTMNGKQNIGTLLQRPNQNDLYIMKDLIETGKVTPVIDRCYKLSEVQAAFHYFGEGHSQGKVVITV
ncbi:NAD(P)-dependent alcohol dehydrogenase [Litchfieldia salsa]|uniref:NADPH:quinone reductase n=1 Tax=Litchfieldia salsa TaxID=930152 RepID=A0A1H0SUT8_9BACI|nr:NAD(P)-dependent alcohol dehydrogenase [Litchfieldia salsa]SDP45454.1 NADPH:quinone reductase [Litchfieldia salsa]